MPQVTRRFSLRATVAGAATGVVSFAGLAVAADTSSALLYVGGVGAAVIGLVVGSFQLRGSASDLMEKPDLAMGGPRRASAIDSPNGKVAAIHSVETDLTHDMRIAKFGLTVVDRQFRDSSYITSTRANAPQEVLESAVGERRMATVEEVHRLPGAVIMPWKDSQLAQYGKALAAEIQAEIPPERVYTVPREGVVSRATVTVCFCAAFAVFGAATGVLMPDTEDLSSVFSTAATTAIDTSSDTGSSEIESAIGQFGLDALAAMKVMAEDEIPGSTEHVLAVTFYGFWTELVVLDEANAQRVIFHASQGDGGKYDPDRVDVTRGAENESGARVRNTFPISVVDTSVVVASYDSITEALGVEQNGSDRVEIDKVSSEDTPIVEVWVDGDDGSGSYYAQLDGTIAPIFDVRDTSVALDQVAAALPLAGIDATTPRIASICIACNSNSVDVVVDPAYEGGDESDISLRSGVFPKVTVDEGYTPKPDEVFSLSQITAAQLDAIAAANADRVGAEPADTASARFTITKETLPDTDYDAPRVHQVKTEFGTMSASGAIYLPDGTFVATD